MKVRIFTKFSMINRVGRYISCLNAKKGVTSIKRSCDKIYLENSDSI